MNDPRPLPLAPVELYTMVLVASPDLPGEAWPDFLSLLVPPTPQPDPAPGVEFAPAEAVELPQPVREAVLAKVRELDADYRQREAKLAKDRPPADVRESEAALAAARVRRLVQDLRRLGCDLRAELE